MRAHPPTSRLAGLVSLTLLYNDDESRLPAKAGIRIENTGFRIKSGMTECVKFFLRQYTERTTGSTQKSKSYWDEFWRTGLFCMGLNTLNN